MSTAWQTSSKRRQTCSRNLQCEESPTRTRSRRAPKGRQQQRPLLPKNNGPQVDLPPLLLPRPLPCPPLMAVRLWEVILAEVPHNHLPFPWPFTRSPSPSGTPSAPAQSSSSSVPAPSARPEDQQDDQPAVPAQKGVQAGAPPIPVHFAMKFSLSYPIFQRNGLLSKLT